MKQYRVLQIDKERQGYKEAIIDLWKHNIIDVPAARFDWLYVRNPEGPAATWLALEQKQHTPAGIGSLYPRRMIVNGTAQIAGVAIDFAMHKSHRVLGPALMIQRAIIAGSRSLGFQFNYAYPTGSSIAVFRRAGYRPVGEIQAFFKLLKIEKKIREYFKVDIAAKGAAVLIGRYLALLDRWRLLRLGGNDTVIEILERCDGRFDTLWTATGAQHPVTGEKSAAFLNWRYAFNTLENYRFFCVCTKDRQRLLGYVVFTLRDDVALAADAFAVNEKEAFALLFLKFAEYLRGKNSAYIRLAYFGKTSMRTRLRKLGFIERRTKSDFFVYGDPSCDPALTRAISDRENWCHFGGDLDLA